MGDMDGNDASTEPSLDSVPASSRHDSSGISVPASNREDLMDTTDTPPQMSSDVPPGLSQDLASANPMNDASTTAAWSVAQLEAMSVREIKAEMTRLGVDSSGCLEKNDLIQKIVSAGYVS